MLPYVQNHIGWLWVFLHDDPKHMVREARTCTEDNSIELLWLPAWSADINSVRSDGKMLNLISCTINPQKMFCLFFVLFHPNQDDKITDMQEVTDSERMKRKDNKKQY